MSAQDNVFAKNWSTEGQTLSRFHYLLLYWSFRLFKQQFLAIFTILFHENLFIAFDKAQDSSLISHRERVFFKSLIIRIVSQKKYEWYEIELKFYKYTWGLIQQETTVHLFLWRVTYYIHSSESWRKKSMK